MFNAESLQEKWNPILEHSELDPIKDTYRKAVTSVLLENQEKFLKEERGLVTEAAPTNSLGGTGYSRVRIGIGKPKEKISAADYVLNDFSEEEKENLEKITNNIIESISILIDKKLELFSSTVNNN